jgi:sugar/nucleoside kinase (ribokinase family)
MSSETTQRKFSELRPGVRISVVGDAFVDVVATGLDVLPTWGHNSLSERVEMYTGGSAGNVVAHLAAFFTHPHTTSAGTESAAPETDAHITAGSYPSPAYIAHIGRDALGNYIARHQAHRGVDTSLLLRDEAAATGGCLVLSSHSAGDRSFVSSLGANATFTPAHLTSNPAVLAKLAASDHIHLSNLLGLPRFAAPGARAGAGSAGAAETSSLADVLISLRCTNPALTVSVDPQNANGAPWLNPYTAAVLRQCTVFLPNEVEAACIADYALAGALVKPHSDGRTFVAAPAPADPAAWVPPSAAALAAAAAASSSAVVPILTALLPVDALLVLKEGPRGARVFRNGALLHAQPVFGACVVDTTGGGDSFDAAFLASWLSGHGPALALAAGCAAGALRVGVVSGSSHCPPWGAIVATARAGAAVPYLSPTAPVPAVLGVTTLSAKL